jgi:2-polyprenyl-3-methyl-5-hydroxy-6-metoxy-1,4-benzoquinol methylase
MRKRGRAPTFGGAPNDPSNDRLHNDKFASSAPPAHCILGVTLALISAIFLIHFYHEAWEEFGMSDLLMDAARQENQANDRANANSVKDSLRIEHEDASSSINTQQISQQKQQQHLKSVPEKKKVKKNDQPAKDKKGKNPNQKNNPKPQQQEYDPLQCQHNQGGKCHDVEGGAWTYKRRNGQCVHNEQTIPGNRDFIRNLPRYFPGVRQNKGVLDFGGGLGIYLTGFRNHSRIPKQNLVTMEPHALGKCLLNGITQDTTNLVETDLKQLPIGRYDMIMTIEVLEHIPVQHHQHLIDAFTKMSNQWLIFSAAHPGQPGQGHVGPSMKTRVEWIAQITKNKQWIYDATKSQQVLATALELLQQNLVVFRKSNYKNGTTNAIVLQ